MSDFDRIKYNRLLRTRIFELGSRQSKEFNELIELNANNHNSSNFLKARLELKEKHYKERLDIIIDSLLRSVSDNSIIEEDDKKIFIELLTTRGYIEQEKNDLRSALISYGLTPPNVIIDEKIMALENHLNSILSNARDILEISIDDHNKIVKPKRNSKSNDFWNRYAKDIIIGIIVTVIGGVILYLIIGAI